MRIYIYLVCVTVDFILPLRIDPDGGDYSFRRSNVSRSPGQIKVPKPCEDAGRKKGGDERDGRTAASEFVVVTRARGGATQNQSSAILFYETRARCIVAPTPMYAAAD